MSRRAFPGVDAGRSASVESGLPDLLETPRLLLREPIFADARHLFDAYTHDGDVARFMTWRPHAHLGQTEAFIDECIQAWSRGLRRPYIVAPREQPSLAIGMLEVRATDHGLNIGYVLARRWWGQGLMPEALSALAESGLALPRTFRIEATCDVDNIASARTLEKAGFNREGRLERFTVHPNIDVQPRACLLYARYR